MWILLGICTVLAYLAQWKRDRFKHENAARDEWLFTLLLIVALVLFSGLRISYNDTGVYLAQFWRSPPLSEFWHGATFSLGANPGFDLVNSLLLSATHNQHLFLMFCSAITVGVYVYFLRMHSPMFGLSVFLLLTSTLYIFTLAAVKQTLAMAIGLIAVELALRRKWISFVVVILISAMIHPYVLMFLAVPLLTFKPWTGWTYATLIGTATAANAFGELIQPASVLVQALGDSYTAEELTGEGVSPFRFAAALSPVLLSFIFRRHLFAESTREENLMVNGSHVHAALMFVALYGHANLWGRLATYFALFGLVSIPWMIYTLRRGRMSSYAPLIQLGVVVGYLIFFYLQLFTIKPFDSNYVSITFTEFLKGLG